MELKLTADEVSDILLDAIKDKTSFPLNRCMFKANYGRFEGVELYYEAPPTPEAQARIDAILAEPTTNLTALVAALDGKEAA